MDILKQLGAIEAELEELKESLSKNDRDYDYVSIALKALRRSMIAYSQTRHSNDQLPFKVIANPLCADRPRYRPGQYKQQKR